MRRIQGDDGGGVRHSPGEGCAALLRHALLQRGVEHPNRHVLHHHHLPHHTCPDSW